MPKKKDQGRPRKPSAETTKALAEGGASVGAAAVTGAAGLALVAALIPAAVGLAVGKLLNWRQELLRDWWVRLCEESGRTYDEVKVDYQWKAANDPDVARVVVDSVQALLAADPAAMPAIAALGHEYFARPPDRFFRSMMGLLPSLSASELVSLRGVFAALEPLPGQRDELRLQWGVARTGGPDRLVVVTETPRGNTLPFYVGGGDRYSGPVIEHLPVLFRLLRTHGVGEERPSAAVHNDPLMSWSAPIFVPIADVRRMAELLKR